LSFSRFLNSPLEKSLKCKVKIKRGNEVENLLNLTNLLVFISALDKDPGQKSVPCFG
jgi:hypothetical protein